MKQGSKAMQVYTHAVCIKYAIDSSKNKTLIQGHCISKINKGDKSNKHTVHSNEHVTQ